MDRQEETVRLLALQLRLQFDNQADVIREFSKAGFGPKRIADLIGTTPGTVTVTLAKTKKRAAKPRTTPKRRD